ncbi:MAG: hypothetical protein IPG76_22845 [Acidobacteria bacterium]|nr:hypothetical protein [Acidobacteriota bacterium]
MNRKSPGKVEEQPIGNEDNRIYASSQHWPHNSLWCRSQGFFFLRHIMRLGMKGSFDLYRIVFIPEIPASDYKDIFFTWRPLAEGDPHNCVKVELRRLVSDTNAADNEAQQNFAVRPSSHSSPYDQIVFPFQNANRDPQPKLVYYRAEGVPENWGKSLTPTKRLLMKDEKITGELKVRPPDDEPSCKNYDFKVTAWTPRGDTLIRLGGTTIRAELRNRTMLKLDGAISQCQMPTSRKKMRLRPETSGLILRIAFALISKMARKMFTDSNARMSRALSSE